MKKERHSPSLLSRSTCPGAWLCVCILSHFSGVQLFASPWTIDHQAPVFLGFSGQEYWSELPCLPSGDLPEPGIEPESPVSPALAGRFINTEPPGKPLVPANCWINTWIESLSIPVPYRFLVLKIFVSHFRFYLPCFPVTLLVSPCHTFMCIRDALPSSLCTQILASFFFSWLCHMACRISVPRPGIEPGPRQLEAQNSNP